MKLDQVLQKRYHQWCSKNEEFYKKPADITEDGYLQVNRNHWDLYYGEEKTPILAFPPGCKGEDDTTATEWQRSQLPKSINMSASLLFQHFCQSENPDIFLEPTPIPERLTIGMGHYVSVVLECDRSITIYPTPSAFEDLDDLLKMKPIDASYELFEDLVCNGWEIDTDGGYECLTEDGFFYPDDGEQFWAYGWSYNDHVFRCLHEDILLRGEARMSYYRNDLSDRQLSAIRGKSLAQKVAEECELEVVIE
jgi:hypothetical protein